MMDDVLGSVIGVLIGSAAILGVIFLVSGSLDASVVDGCKKNGYWQTGQTRIICTVEERK